MEMSGENQHDETFLFDEREDELEEFDNLENLETQIDPDVNEWDEDWDVTGWDDEDMDDEFTKQLHNELQEFEKMQKLSSDQLQK
ncbi:uncharacterized protein CMU_035560 [Cryptosporidium muris RN66]|uniref:DSS1/SEM1 family protein n=1 Tax=Cryptosporidium muris (strain RN66) TaxID=441375 RepID=B6AGP3_CRYMR|nr:uncharacterized protein CMU_035560 [Cryptosporidium muris RN66]EEA07384.1 hypothetical protein, conserved [Cryptosporidium muris RN66]|eukprot:XP_002141733.1 hypothetical protein [Cryptosporidium muris RN66]